MKLYTCGFIVVSRNTRVVGMTPRKIKRRKRLHRAVKKNSSNIIWRCPVCKMDFMLKQRLSCHLRKTHLFCGVMPQYKCNICGQICSTRFGFDVHKRKTINELRNDTMSSEYIYLIKTIQACHGYRLHGYLEAFKRHLK